VVLLLAGGLFVVSGYNSDGTDLRPGRYTDLAGLVRSESDRTQGLQGQVGDLNREVDGLTESVRDERVDTYRRRVRALSGDAGLTPERGEGVRVVLSDAPRDVIESTTRDLNLLVVHQQDIQAVVNALWAGGAEAVTVAGQRIISTTGIKCEGNAVQLDGIPYPQPYVIEAVGDEGALTTAVADDDYLANYRSQADVPDIAVGWDFETRDDVVAPAYDGLLDLTYARPMTPG
jgi:uncharacterized protein YlxW (UPF0749 family)